MRPPGPTAAPRIRSDWDWQRRFSPRDRAGPENPATLSATEDSPARPAQGAPRRPDDAPPRAPRAHTPMDMPARGRPSADTRTLDGPSARPHDHGRDHETSDGFRQKTGRRQPRADPPCDREPSPNALRDAERVRATWAERTQPPGRGQNPSTNATTSVAFRWTVRVRGNPTLGEGVRRLAPDPRRGSATMGLTRPVSRHVAGRPPEPRQSQHAPRTRRPTPSEERRDPRRMCTRPRPTRPRTCRPGTARRAVTGNAQRPLHSPRLVRIGALVAIVLTLAQGPGRSRALPDRPTRTP